MTASTILNAVSKMEVVLGDFIILIQQSTSHTQALASPTVVGGYQHAW